MKIKGLDGITNLDELAKVIEFEDKCRLEHPCCYNCKKCYTEYGTDFCETHDYPLDDMDQKCEDWT